MRRMLIGVLGAVAVVVVLAAQANNPNPKPSCNMCPGTYIPVSELEAYRQKAVKENLVDQQVRDIEIGKAHIGIGMVHRGKLAQPAKDSVAEHDLVSEVYHIIDGSATLVLGPDITNMDPEVPLSQSAAVLPDRFFSPTRPRRLRVSEATDRLARIESDRPHVHDWPTVSDAINVRR